MGHYLDCNSDKATMVTITDCFVDKERVKKEKMDCCGFDSFLQEEEDSIENITTL